MATKAVSIIEMNNAAITQGMEALGNVSVPESWKSSTDSAVDQAKFACACSSEFRKAVPEFISSFLVPMNRQDGDKLPVGAFLAQEDGTYPFGTSAYEKRGIAINVPQWQADKCIQCNQCSFVCPHACYSSDIGQFR